MGINSGNIVGMTMMESGSKSSVDAQLIKITEKLFGRESLWESRGAT